MQLLTKKTKYGLRALLALARKKDQEPVLIAALASQEGIPKKFLELILLELKNKGILQSKKGKGGGYLLGKDPETIRLGEIVRALEGPYASENDAQEDSGVRAVMQEIRDSTAAILDGTSLMDLLRRSERLEQEKNRVSLYSI